MPPPKRKPAIPVVHLKRQEKKGNITIGCDCGSFFFTRCLNLANPEDQVYECVNCGKVCRVKLEVETLPIEFVAD